MKVYVPREVCRGAMQVVDIAHRNGWWTLVTEAEGEYRGKRVVSLLVKGRRGDQKFLVQYLDGRVQSAYWWTKEQQWRDGKDGVGGVFQAERPMPTRVNVTELKKRYLVSR